jgi:hypothetical protein
MAHPSRANYFGYLKEKLGNDIPFSIDTGFGLWNNRKMAELMFDKDAEFHLVLQDDAIIGKDFINEAEKILTDENMAYSFYFGNRRNLRKAADKGMIKGHVISDWLNWGLAVCLPTKMIPEIMRACDRMKMRYLKRKGIKIYYTMPSLIDHRAGEKSLIGDSIGRKARYFIGE